MRKTAFVKLPFFSGLEESGVAQRSVALVVKNLFSEEVKSSLSEKQWFLTVRNAASPFCFEKR